MPVAREVVAGARAAGGRAAGAANELRSSLSFTRRRSSNTADRSSNTADKVESDAPAGSHSQIRLASTVDIMRRTLSFGRRSNDALPRNWKRAEDAKGHEVFFNMLTKETTEDRPKHLQRHWREALDKSTGTVYYWNVRTRAVRWEREDVDHDDAAAEPSRALELSQDEEGEAPPPPQVREKLKEGVKEGAEKMKRVLSFGRRGRKSSTAGEPVTLGGGSGASRGAGGGVSGGGGASRGGGGGGGGGPTCSELNIRKVLDIKDYMFSKRSGETLVKLPGAVGGQQFIIEECDDCDIFLLDWSAAVTIDRCKRCRLFIGPCESSVFVRNCEDIRAVVACQQFRTRDVHKLDVLLLSPSQPSIEATTEVPTGAPLAAHHPPKPPTQTTQPTHLATPPRRASAASASSTMS